MKRHYWLAHAASFIVLSTLVILAFGSGDDKTDEPGRPPAPSISIGSQMRISSDSWFGCTDRDYYEKLLQYLAQNDDEAFKRGLAAGLLTGSCTGFKDGEPVYIMDTAIFSGLIKVRRGGETMEYWTNLEAVK